MLLVTLQEIEVFVVTRKILMVIAPEDFRDEEYQVPREIFETEGFEVTVASSRLGTAQGSRGMTTKVDCLLDGVRASDYDAVVSVGGKGSWDYFENPEAQRLAQETAGSSRTLLCAICSAPGILAKAGVLAGKRVTSFQRETGLLKEKGAFFTGKEVETDGRLITGNGPAAAEAFARSIVAALKVKQETKL